MPKKVVITQGNVQTNQNVKEEIDAEEFKLDIQQYSLNVNIMEVKEVLSFASELSLQEKVKNEAEVEDGFRISSMNHENVKCDSKENKKRVSGKCIDTNSGTQNETPTASIKQELDVSEPKIHVQEYKLCDNSFSFEKMINNSLNETVCISERGLQVKSEIDFDDINRGYNLEQEVVKSDFEHATDELNSCVSMQSNDKSYIQNHPHLHERLITFREDSKNVFKTSLKSSINKNELQDNNFKHSFSIISIVKERFQCKFCEYKTKYKHDLKRHFNSIHNKSKNEEETEQIYQCQFCKCKYRHKRSLNSHINHQHNEKAEWLHCDLCEYKTKRKFCLTSHKMKHDENPEIDSKTHSANREIYHCQVCEFKTKYKYNLKRHIDQEHGDKRGKESSEIYQCQFCEYKSKHNYALKRHIDYKHNENAKWYQCGFCDYKTKYKSCLVYHFKIQHDDSSETVDDAEEKLFHCDSCKCKFKYKRSLKRHIDCKHNKKAKWLTCTFCEYKSKYSSSLERHIECKHNERTE